MLKDEYKYTNKIDIYVKNTEDTEKILEFLKDKKIFREDIRFLNSNIRNLFK